MLNEAIPFYEDGDHISGYCTAPVSGKRFVKISGSRSGGVFDPTATTAGDGGAPHIAHADPGGRIHGVSSYDGAAGATIDVARGSKMVLPVVAGAALSAFDEVAVGQGGRAVPAGHDIAVAAHVTIDPAGTNNAIDYTADTAGSEGNDITVAYVAADGGHPAGTVAVNGNDIVVYVTAGTTTAAQVVAAVNGDANASPLVNAANTAANDGTGTVPAVAATPLAGGDEGGSADQAVGYVLADCATGADAQVSLY